MRDNNDDYGINRRGTKGNAAAEGRRKKRRRGTREDWRVKGGTRPLVFAGPRDPIGVLALRSRTPFIHELGSHHALIMLVSRGAIRGANLLESSPRSPRVQLRDSPGLILLLSSSSFNSLLKRVSRSDFRIVRVNPHERVADGGQTRG